MYVCKHFRVRTGFIDFLKNTRKEILTIAGNKPPRQTHFNHQAALQLFVTYSDSFINIEVTFAAECEHGSGTTWALVHRHFC